MLVFDEPVILVDQVSLRFRISSSGSAYTFGFSRTATTIEALKDVTFAINRGESVGILGRNGSGKSSLLSVMSGRLSPSQGRVLVFSTPTLLSVSAALQKHLSGETNSRLGLLAMGMPPEEVDRQVSVIHEWTELGDAFRRPLKTYSSGMKARLKFAIATSTASDTLLVDEALSTGDSTFALKAKERMDSFLAESGTVVFVSHSANAIRKQCTRAIWLSDGEIVADGEAKTVSKLYESWNKARAQNKVSEADRILCEVKASYRPPTLQLRP